MGCTSRYITSGNFKSEKAKSSIFFNKNGTFKYNQSLDFFNNNSFGKWDPFGKNKIRINSLFQDKKILLFTNPNIDSKEFDAKSKRLVLVKLPHEVAENYEVIFFTDNKLNKPFIKEDYAIWETETKFDSFFIAITGKSNMPSRFLDTLFSTQFIVTGNKMKNLTLSINFNDSLFNYKVFTNEVAEFNRKGVKIGGIFYRRSE